MKNQNGLLNENDVKTLDEILEEKEEIVDWILDKGQQPRVIPPMHEEWKMEDFETVEAVLEERALYIYEKVIVILAGSDERISAQQIISMLSESSTNVKSGSGTISYVYNFLGDTGLGLLTRHSSKNTFIYEKKIDFNLSHVDKIIHVYQTMFAAFTRGKERRWGKENGESKERVREVVRHKHKPPVGICPRSVFYNQRAKEITDAIARYLDAGKVPPEDWVEELSDIIFLLRER